MNVQEKSLYIFVVCNIYISKFVVSNHYMWSPSSNYSAHSRWPKYFRPYCSVV